MASSRRKTSTIVCSLCEMTISNEMEAIYLDQSYMEMVQKRRNKFGYAHRFCVREPAMPKDESFRRWATLIVVGQLRKITDLETRVAMMENAILSLPEGMAGDFRDQLAHEREFYAKGGENR